jgi:hypothetical protein
MFVRNGREGKDWMGVDFKKVVEIFGCEFPATAQPLAMVGSRIGP